MLGSIAFGNDRIDDVALDALVAGGIGALALVATFVAFLVRPGLTTIPLLVFVAVVTYGWFVHQAETAKALTLLTTIVAVLVLTLITVYLFAEALPSIREMGLIDMLTRTKDPMWAPSENIFSLVPAMWGTFVTTILATLVAAPLGVAGALFISEIAPAWAREIVKPAIEMLAGVPSIVYGFIGYVVINQYMMNVFGLPTFGSLFVVGLVIGVMALPTVVSVAEDAISSVPDDVKDGSVAMGATEWQTMKSITLPAAFSGISAAILLGVGRAVGETMAATVILGHIQALPKPLYDVFGNTDTLTALIASQYGNSSGLHLSALFAAGVVLFVTVMSLSIVSQYVEYRMKQKLRGNE